MRVYAESNFVLEIALKQEELSACEGLLEDATSRRISLIVPAISVFEPYYKIAGNGKRRRDLAQQVDVQARELGRTKGAEESSQQLRDLIQAFAKSEDAEQQGFSATIASVLRIGDLIPLTRDVIILATADILPRFHLKLPDALVYASLLQHIKSAAKDDACFVTKNSKDFDDPDIELALLAAGSRLRAASLPARDLRLEACGSETNAQLTRALFSGPKTSHKSQAGGEVAPSRAPARPQGPCPSIAR